MRASRENPHSSREAASSPFHSRPLAVVFDLDGLMFNTEELYQDVGSELLRRRGRVFTSQLRDQMMGRPGRDALKIMIQWHGLTDTVERLQADTDEIFAEILALRLAPMPGLLELLDSLDQARIPKAIATSSRRVFVDQVLAPFGLAPRFQFVLTAEDVTQGKPHPEIYQTAAQRFGLLPPQLMVFEDSGHGCRAAVAAGAQVIAVPGSHSLSHDFTGVAHVVESLTDRRIFAALGLS